MVGLRTEAIDGRISYLATAIRVSMSLVSAIRGRTGRGRFLGKFLSCGLLIGRCQPVNVQDELRYMCCVRTGWSTGGVRKRDQQQPRWAGLRRITWAISPPLSFKKNKSAHNPPTSLSETLLRCSANCHFTASASSSALRILARPFCFIGSYRYTLFFYQKAGKHLSQRYSDLWCKA